MAQLVEQLIRNQQVAGSNPAISSISNRLAFFKAVLFSANSRQRNNVWRLYPYCAFGGIFDAG